jgi:hypothetical protein
LAKPVHPSCAVVREVRERERLLRSPSTQHPGQKSGGLLCCDVTPRCPLGLATSGGRSRDDAVSAVCTVTAFALGCAVAETSYCSPVASDDPVTAERQRLRRITRALPAETPDRLVDAALAVCGCNATEMFTNRLDLNLRGCETDRKPNRRPRSGRG